MGLWRNTLFVENGDYRAVATAIEAIATEEGRVSVEPEPREPEPYDDMQYGGGDSWRWGFAVFPGAEGWTVVQMAPMEILLYPGAPGHGGLRLGRLTRRLGCRAFQYNVYDGSAATLVEADATGHIEASGVHPQDPTRFHGRPPPADRLTPRFVSIDPGPTAARARSRGVRQVTGVLGAVPAHLADSGLGRALAERVSATETWLHQVDAVVQRRTVGSVRMTSWRASAADVVARLAVVEPPPVDLQAESDAISAVFGGTNAEHADNLISVHYLVRHELLPIGPSIALYLDGGRTREGEQA